MGRSETIFTGAAIGMALLEATAAQARPIVSEGLRINARNTPAPSGDMYQTGRGLLAAGDVTGAMAAFRQALLEAPQSVDALNGLGVCYDRLGRFDISRGYYDSALAIDPDSPLVLNNLGYSLYLQGQFAAAIPMLQRAGGADDPAVSAASQRVLALVAVQMRDAATRASARSTRASQASAEATSPGARIEVLASGEQRLVFGSAAPDSALVAALGDAAALVTITRRDAPQVSQADDMVRISGGDVVGNASGDLPAVVYLSTSAPATSRTMTLSMPGVLALDEPAHSHVAANPVVDVPDSGRTTPVNVRTVAAAEPQRRRSRSVPVAPTPGGRGDDAPLLVPRTGATDSRGREGAPAWLLSSRRNDRPTAGPPRAGAMPAASTAVAAFDSDVVELNRFAARMRGDVAVLVADPDADRQAAIARLEALIARIRAK
ncbi:tetratricopeptide repeat protein [Sandarakinorhabdus sp. DWP1-3-1]|uniref:tetratricopeptide repeat protein n=1 Tax=Sandarakinorhabdus sp. DWP1-3-1 TaxID=2804627 RepID=UPI003CF5F0FB